MISLWWLHEGNRALRVGDWKIVAAGAKAPWELYDLGNDRGESNNLADKYPEKVSELAAIWDQHTEATRARALEELPAKAESPNAAKKKARERPTSGRRWQEPPEHPHCWLPGAAIGR